MITVLGATGSIGTQTLDIARERGLPVLGLGAGRNLTLLQQQVREFRPRFVSVHPEVREQARRALEGSGARLLSTEELAAEPCSVVVAALPGLAGLPPLRAALQAGQAVALATKEAMAAAPGPVWAAAQAGGGRIVPVDSEHTALYQLLVGQNLDEVAELVLTASGGPFREGPADLSAVTPEQALRHPTWSMGPKVTVDSATLMNKGIEVLEAGALYGVPLSRVRVKVHPQSVVHGLLRFHDGNWTAHLGGTDMRLAIAYALDSAPTGMRAPGDVRGGARTPRAGGLDLSGGLSFFEPDLNRFPALGLAYAAGEQGGYAPLVLNAADEVAVSAFLQGRLGFPGIAALVEGVLAETPPGEPDWDGLGAVQDWAERRAHERLGAA